jgi:hypothetical protein
MAAARQKEMNVSITEEATISLTRSFGGATVVRVEAIAKGPARRSRWLESFERNHRSATSLIFNQSSVNEK